MNYARFINSFSASRVVSPLRKLTEIQNSGGPSLISLGTGAPNPTCFPFKSIVVETKENYRFVLEGKLLNEALNYSASPGMANLVSFLKGLQVRVHNPPLAKSQDPERQMDLIVTPGSQDGLSKTLEMLISPNDYVLVEEPTYPGALATMRPYNVKYLKIESDSNGIKPESLRSLLSPWKPEDARSGNVKMPKVLLVQPNNCNPIGVSLPLERRKEIYKIAQEYDLLIVEDDPYYFLTYDKELPRSFLSLDTDGRVIKLDSFSKVLSSGLRIGTLTGPKKLVERVTIHLSSTSQHCSSLSQVLAMELFKNWDYDGFFKHARRTADFYQGQCQIMLNAAEKHLSGLAEWYKPTGGMFLWMKVLGVKDTYKMITQKALSKQVVLAPGSFFMCDDTKPTPYLRASYSFATETQIDEAFKRLAELIREEQKS